MQPRYWFWICLLLALTAIWGSTFVVIKQTAIDAFAPSLLNLVRFSMAAVIFSPFLRGGKELWRDGLELAFWLFAGYATQAVGLQYTTVTRSAFITSLPVILVPLMTSMLGRRVRPLIWVAAVGSLIGVAFLSYDNAPPNIGDLWTLGTALTYALFILRLETLSHRHPPAKLTAVMLVGVALLCGGWVAAERPAANSIPWKALIYLGLLATAVSTWLQTIVQRHIPATTVAIIYMLEPVWASLFAWMIFHDRLGPRGWIGCSLILLASLLTQYRPRSLPEGDTDDDFDADVDAKTG